MFRGPRWALSNHDFSTARQFQHPLSSFACLDSLTHPASTHYLGVSRDTSSPGSSGHRLEVIEAPAPRQTAFLDGAVLFEDRNEPTGLTTLYIPRPASAHTPDQPLEAPEISLSRPTLDRGRRLSLDVSNIGFDRHQTPRPSGSVTPRQLSRNGQPVLSTRDPERLGRLGLTALSADISSLMRERIERGYGSDVNWSCERRHHQGLHRSIPRHTSMLHYSMDRSQKCGTGSHVSISR